MRLLSVPSTLEVRMDANVLAGLVAWDSAGASGGGRNRSAREICAGSVKVVVTPPPSSE